MEHAAKEVVGEAGLGEGALGLVDRVVDDVGDQLVAIGVDQLEWTLEVGHESWGPLLQSLLEARA
ncbi:hypothetical protein [Myxococcus stipitatus]|uniref:hypothetical protein n=1 Tax=Myxococcus stipitatus TaxID=83455 RepID=UPI0030CEE8CB